MIRAIRADQCHPGLFGGYRVTTRFLSITDNANARQIDRWLAAARELASDRDAYPPEGRHGLKVPEVGNFFRASITGKSPAHNGLTPISRFAKDSTKLLRHGFRLTYNHIHGGSQFSSNS